jgi:hypothetical protein
MAAPQWQLIPLPLGRGLAQGEDARLVTPGSFGEANNVVVDRAGRFTKRTGWGRLPRTAETGEEMPSPDRVDVAASELLQVDTGEGSLWSWGPGRSAWERVGSLPEFRVERAPLARPAASITSGGLVRFGADDRYELVWWQLTLGGDLLPYRQIRDTETGALIARDDDVYSTARLTVPVGLRVGTSAWLVYSGGDVRLARYGGDLVTFTDTSLSGPSHLAFDAVEYSSTLGAVVFAELASAFIQVQLLEEDGALDSDVTLTAAANVRAGVDALAVCKGTSGQLWVGAVLDYAGSYDVVVWRLASDLTVVAGYPKVVENRIVDPKNLQLGLDPSGNCWVTFSGKILTSSEAEETIHAKQIEAAGNTVSTWRKTTYRTFPASGLFSTSEGLYLAAIVEGDGRFTGIPGATPIETIHAVLLRVDNSTDATPMGYSGVMAATTSAAGLTARQRWVETSDGWQTALPALALTNGQGDDLQGLDRVTLEGAGRRTARSLALAQQAPVWGLCGLFGYDTFDACDVGFLQPPAIDIDPVTGLGTGAGPYYDEGIYVFIARYERLDDRGVLHVSPWSEPAAVEIAAAATYNSIALTVRGTCLTQHGRRGGGRRYSVAIYRTEVDGASAGVIRYYRLTEYGDEAFQFDFGDESISYVDTPQDVTALGLGTWTTAGRLPPLAPPPPRDLVACKGRLWLAPADQTRQVWFSQQILQDEIPWFHPGLSVQLLDTEERIDALAALDDRVVVFTRSRIYLIEGDGPLDTGVGSFVGPNLISSAFGCIERRSVISTSRGVYFLAACGLCLLDRGLSVQVVGDPVRDLIEAGAIEGVVYDEAQARVIWLRAFGEGVHDLVIYDERHAAWTTASSLELDTIRSIAWDRGRSALVLAYSGGICQEGYGAAPGFDGDPTDPTWFATALATPWIRSGAPGSWMQAELVHLEGEVLGPSTTTVSWYRDYSATADGSVTLDATAAARGDRLVRQVGAKSQTCSALKITLVEAAPEALPDDVDAPHGIRWWGLTLKASVQPGEARIAPELRKGIA